MRVTIRQRRGRVEDDGEDSGSKDTPVASSQLSGVAMLTE